MYVILFILTYLNILIKLLNCLGSKLYGYDHRLIILDLDPGNHLITD